MTYLANILAGTNSSASRSKRFSGSENDCAGKKAAKDAQNIRKQAKAAARGYCDVVRMRAALVRTRVRKDKGTPKEVTWLLNTRREEKPPKFLKHLIREMKRLLRREGFTVKYETEEFTLPHYGSGLLNPTSYKTTLYVSW